MHEEAFEGWRKCSRRAIRWFRIHIITDAKQRIFCRTKPTGKKAMISKKGLNEVGPVQQTWSPSEGLKGGRSRPQTSLRILRNLSEREGGWVNEHAANEQFFAERSQRVKTQ